MLSKSTGALGASDRILYQVRLAAVPGVSVHAAGLEPLHRTPKHIHVNPT